MFLKDAGGEVKAIIRNIRKSVGKVESFVRETNSRCRLGHVYIIPLLVKIAVSLLLIGIFLGHKNYFSDRLSKEVSLQGTVEAVDGLYTYQYKAKLDAARKYLEEISFSTGRRIKLEDIELSMEEGKKTSPMKDIEIRLMKKTKKFYQYEIVVNKKLKAGKQYSILMNISQKEAIKDLNKIRIVTGSFLGDVYNAAFWALLLPLLVWILSGLYKGQKKKAEYVLPSSFFLLMVYSVFTYVMIELLFQKSIWNSSFLKVLGNSLFYFIVYILLLFLLNSQRKAVWLGSSFFYLVALVNHFLVDFRNQPIQPVDITSYKTAMEVSGQYTYEITYPMIIVTIIWIDILLITGIIRERKIAKKWKGKLVTLITGLFLVVFARSFFLGDFYHNLFHIESYQFSPMLSYIQEGFAQGFLAIEKISKISRPKGYSTKKVKEVEEKFKKEEGLSDKKGSSASVEKPNIVVIMNETFADLSYIREFETTTPYLEYWNQLSENAIKGHLLVSVFGGNTANSEYEFLTGNSIEEFKVFNVPYNNNISSKTYSLARTLRAQGYRAFALHPQLPENWKRDKVYPLLGFEKFYSYKDFLGAQTFRGHISDASTFSKIEEILKEGRRKQDFVFTVTMQNHSGYNVKGVEETTQVVGQDYPDVNQYLTSIKESDRAFHEFLEKMQDFEEPTIVVMFGDHYPGVDEKFYDWLYEKKESELSLEEVQKKFTVPFVIWANYDIEEQDELITSANYLSSQLLELAGLEMAPYNRFLLDMRKEIPAMNLNGYILKDGSCHSYKEKTQVSDRINAYDILQYNSLFDENGRVDSFFSIDKKDRRK